MLITLPRAALRLESSGRVVGTRRAASSRSHRAPTVGPRPFGRHLAVRYTLGNGWYVFEASSDDEGTSGGGGGASEQKVVTYTEEALEGERSDTLVLATTHQTD